MRFSAILPAAVLLFTGCLPAVTPETVPSPTLHVEVRYDGFQPITVYLGDGPVLKRLGSVSTASTTSFLVHGSAARLPRELRLELRALGGVRYTSQPVYVSDGQSIFWGIQQAGWSYIEQIVVRNQVP